MEIFKKLFKKPLTTEEERAFDECKKDKSCRALFDKVQVEYNREKKEFNMSKSKYEKERAEFKLAESDYSREKQELKDAKRELNMAKSREGKCLSACEYAAREK